MFVDLYRKSRQAEAAAAMRARIERERAEAAAREAEHERIAQLKDEFLATLAHELRTPLTSLVVAADTLQRLPVQDARLARMHGLIRGQLAHLARLVEDSLEVARFTHGKLVLRPEDIDLRDAIQRGIELSQPALDGQGVELVLTLPPAPVPTQADPVRLAQVTANLVVNAAKFSDWGGRVAVGLETSEHEAVIKVRDWGRGIPAPDLARIFEPFVQSHAGDTWRGGLGIGLALVKKLVALHGGSVHVASAGSGHGAEFVVTLPRAAMANSIAPTDIAAGSKTRTPARVLVVDDNSAVRNAVGLFLELAGHSVTMADCGRAALVAIERNDPDIVLLDIDLPDFDGYAVAKQVRASRMDARRPRLVAMTGSVGAAARERALRTGFDAHVPKPIDGRTLVRIMNET